MNTNKNKQSHILKAKTSKMLASFALPLGGDIIFFSTRATVGFGSSGTEVFLTVGSLNKRVT